MFGDRIKQLRKAKGLTVEQFGESLGGSKSVAANLEYGRVEPSEMVLNLICLKHGVSYKWLKDGIGEMYASEEDEVLAALDDLMTGEGHEKTKAMIKALARMSDKQLDTIDAYVDALLEELGR
ncbi:MAG: helix-turn-helix transcriptional regulator [Candidatus Limiplasma sp.]|nr:helix-turn-helix transcriptional regulator [Candidatus Limiplasma sp.]